YPHAMREALLQHDDLLRACIESRGGHIFKTMGDAFCAVFPDPRGALEAVLVSQQSLPALALETAVGTRPLKVRMAVHTGGAQERAGVSCGRRLTRVAGLRAPGQGGRVRAWAAPGEALGGARPPGASLLAGGSHRLRDLSEPVQVFQLLHPCLESDFPPLRSLS